MKTYTVVLTPDYDSGGFTVTVPALPGCVTDGETIDDALARASEAITLYLRGEDEDAFLEPQTGPRVVVAQVSVD